MACPEYSTIEFGGRGLKGGQDVASERQVFPATKEEKVRFCPYIVAGTRNAGNKSGKIHSILMSNFSKLEQKRTSKNGSQHAFAWGYRIIYPLIPP